MVLAQSQSCDNFKRVVETESFLAIIVTEDGKVGLPAKKVRAKKKNNQAETIPI